MAKRLLKAMLSDGGVVSVKYDHLEVNDAHFLVYDGDLFKASFSIETTIIDVTDSELKKDLNAPNVKFENLTQCADEADEFARRRLNKVKGLLSEDYITGYKKGIEHYLIEKNKLK